MSAETIDGNAKLPLRTSLRQRPVRTPRRRVNPFVVGAIVLVLLAVGVGWYLYAQGYEDTDDAQVDGHLNPIASRIDGTIKAVHVDDNQAVQAGALLVELDPSDDQVALAAGTGAV